MLSLSTFKNMKICTFGCWNNPNNLNGKNPYFYEILEYLTKYECDEIIVLGDNYYPNKPCQKKDKKDKKDKKATIDWNEHISFFYDSITRLININKPIHMIMGNHDIEDFKENNELLLTQLNIPEIHTLFPFNYIEKGNNILLFIDTTIYNLTEITPNLYKIYMNKLFIVLENFELLELLSDILIELNFESKTITDSFQLKELLINTNILTNSQILPIIIQTIQNKFIEYILDKYNNHSIFIFGHQPLISLSKKKDYVSEESFTNTNVGIEEKSFLESLLKILFENIGLRKLYYICADDHLYLKSIIKKNDQTIFQHIYGTGGACLDKCLQNRICENNNIPIEHKGYFIEYIESKDNVYGFGTINIDSIEPPDFNFVEVIADKSKETELSTMKNKYLKYKIKYLNLYKSIQL